MPYSRPALEALLADLVRIDARNPWLIEGGPGEGALAAEVASRCRATAQLEMAIEEVATGRPNVIARLPGSGGGPTLVLNAHLDTVGDASWPGRSMTPVVQGDRFIGLGAADDKGHCAAILLVLEALAARPAPLRGDVVAAFVMDEEATSEGTQDYCRRHRADACLVVEPFGIGRAIATHQGFGWIDIVVRGRAAHGSAPDRGIDAISRAALVIKGLDALGRTWAARPDPLNGATVYHASTIRGGSDYATYPAEVTIGIEIGTQPGETIANRVADIEAIFAKIRRQLPDFEARLEVKLDRNPFLATGHERLLDALRDANIAVLGCELEIAGENAWMDAALVQEAGIPTLSIGASGGNLHASDEWISIPELLQACDILERTAVGYCGDGAAG